MNRCPPAPPLSAELRGNLARIGSEWSIRTDRCRKTPADEVFGELSDAKRTTKCLIAEMSEFYKSLSVLFKELDTSVREYDSGRRHLDQVTSELAGKVSNEGLVIREMEKRRSVLLMQLEALDACREVSHSKPEELLEASALTSIFRRLDKGAQHSEDNILKGIRSARRSLLSVVEHFIERSLDDLVTKAKDSKPQDLFSVFRKASPTLFQCIVIVKKHMGDVSKLPILGSDTRDDADDNYSGSFERLLVMYEKSRSLVVEERLNAMMLKAKTLQLDLLISAISGGFSAMLKAEDDLVSLWFDNFASLKNRIMNKIYGPIIANGISRAIQTTNDMVVLQRAARIAALSLKDKGSWSLVVRQLYDAILARMYEVAGPPPMIR